MPITKRDVEALPPKTRIWDQGRGSVPGFGARCQAKSRVFFIKCSRGGRQRWITIGRYGAPWTVETARAEALRLLGEIVVGNDPAAEKKQAIAASQAQTTVAALCDSYLEAAKAGLVLTRFNRPKRSSTLEIDVGRIERHIKPLIGKVDVKRVDARVVKQLIADISAGKTATDVKTVLRGRAIVKGGSATAARVADLLSGIMAWAVDEGMIAHNPVHGVRRFRSQPRDRFLSNEELKALGKALVDIRQPDSGFHPHVAPIVELLCLTGCRYSEIAELRWNEIDFQERCLRLSETKTGKSMRAIGPAVVDVLRSCEARLGSAYVFPASRGDGPYQGAKRQITALFKAAGIDGATSHTLRHTYASVASSLGYSDSTIGGLLGHANKGITTRYIHRPDDALKMAAEAVSDAIHRLLKGQAGEQPE